MLRVLLARHGQTEWNAAGRFCGQADVGLSPLGVRQAQALAGRLAAEPIERIYISDLLRARQTVEPLLQQRAYPLVADRDLREISFGAWEGLSYAEIQQRDPQALAAWEADWVGQSPPGGESLNTLTLRVQDFFQRLQDDRALEDRRPPQQDTPPAVLLVAHGGSLQVLICLALGLPVQKYWKFRLGNAALSELRLGSYGATLHHLNENCHLAGLEGADGWEN